MAYRDQIIEGSARFPKPAEITYQYGTAGFRMLGKSLTSTAFRVGLLAGIRSRKFNGQTIGVMITASHNPPEDNGVKLVDPMGEMLEQTWEKYATELANAPSDEALATLYEKICEQVKVKPDSKARVIFARDTRASGHTLVTAFVEALKATAVEYTDFKILTTPQLHYLTRCTNTKGTPYEYGEVSEKGYYEKLADAWKLAVKNKKIQGSVTVDCANGVGGPKLRELIKYLPASEQEQGGISIKVVNDDVLKPDNLNMNCGADFVKTQQRIPPSSKATAFERCASLDGDADRLVYYYTDNSGIFHLLDGDRIATLAAVFLGDLLKQTGLADKLTIGVIQTAYANGASTKYLTDNLKVQVRCVNTGVKHLHHAATAFDVGIYFEANGHGTVLFSPRAIKDIGKYQPKSPREHEALETLRAMTNLINQAVGDALSDMLLVEAILAHKGWTVKEWLNTYVDLPNRLRKVIVKDRNLFEATDAERKLVKPEGAQAEIDAVVGKYKQGRSFARASGTEDAVRVYAEAASRDEAEDLAKRVEQIVAKFGGVAN